MKYNSNLSADIAKILLACDDSNRYETEQSLGEILVGMGYDKAPSRATIDRALETIGYTRMRVRKVARLKAAIVGVDGWFDSLPEPLLEAILPACPGTTIEGLVYTLNFLRERYESGKVKLPKVPFKSLCRDLRSILMQADIAPADRPNVEANLESILASDFGYQSMPSRSMIDRALVAIKYVRVGSKRRELLRGFIKSLPIETMQISEILDKVEDAGIEATEAQVRQTISHSGRTAKRAIVYPDLIADLRTISKDFPKIPTSQIILILVEKGYDPAPTRSHIAKMLANQGIERFDRTSRLKTLSEGICEILKANPGVSQAELVFACQSLFVDEPMPSHSVIVKRFQSIDFTGLLPDLTEAIVKIRTENPRFWPSKIRKQLIDEQLVPYQPSLMLVRSILESIPNIGKD